MRLTGRTNSFERTSQSVSPFAQQIGKNVFMKKYSLLLFAAVFLQFAQISAQNLLHYAVSTNGQKGECLFPEDEAGNVVFSSIIDVPCSADSIMLIADDYISAQNITDRCVVKRLSSSSRTNTYSIQLNIGKQSWGIEYWGTPLFIFKRDASHVKFRCIVEARNGKYKYSLVDFETNRNTIRGEAKNDGQPNIIHWQRVNSLTKEKDFYASKHDIKKREVKEVLFDFNSQIAYEACLYQAEYDATIKFEKGLKNLNFSDDFMEVPGGISPSEKALNNKSQGRHFSLSIFGDGFFTQAGEYASENSHSDSNYSNFIGFLLEKGCNVFITSEDHAYEQAGVQELIKQTMIDGYWNVVDDINQAHFVMRYYVNLEGRDRAHLIFETPQGNVKEEISSQGTSESINENREVARSLYLKSVFPLFKKIESKKYPKNLNTFAK